MEYLHCHKCYRRLSPEVKLCMTNCGHIFCKTCVTSTSLSRCLSCSTKNVRIVNIGKEMPNSISCYFSPNLVEEQKLLIRRYEFQLFQFKHLYKHVVNDNRKYERVAAEINKRLAEFKRCASLLRLPSNSLIVRCKTTTENKKLRLPLHKVTTPQNNHSCSMVVSPSNSQYSNILQTLPQTKPIGYMKRVPYLPSPVGSSFSEMSRTSSAFPTPHSNSQSRQFMNGNSKMRAMTAEGRTCLPKFESNLNRNMSGSLCSLVSNSSSIPNSQPDHHINRNNGSIQRLNNKIQALHNSPLNDAMCSVFSNVLDAHNNQSNSTFESGRVSKLQEDKYMYDLRQKKDYIARQHEMLQGKITPNNYPPKSGRLTKQYSTPKNGNFGLSTNKDTSNSSFMTQHKMQTLNEYSMQQNSRKISNKYSKPKQVHNMSAMSQHEYSMLQNKNISDRHLLLHTEMQTSQQNRNSPNEINFLQNQKAVVDSRDLINISRDADSQKNYICRQIMNTNQRANDVEQKKNEMSHMRQNHESIPNRSDQQTTPINKRFAGSPFMKYRKNQNLIYDMNLDTPPNRQICLNIQTPSSEEFPRQKNKEPTHRLISPRASSNLSVSASQPRRQSPYRRLIGGQNNLTEIKTPASSPKYKQQSTPPFHDTLKLLTLAVKQNKIVN